MRQALGLAPFETLRQLANQRVTGAVAALATVHGLRLWAVDGSHLNLPPRASLASAFGRPRSTGAARSLPQAQLVTLDLVRLGWFWDYRLARHDAAELALAEDLCRQLGRRDLLLADRLYFHPHWFADLQRRGVKFLCRATRDRWQCLTPASQRRVARQRRRAHGHVDLWVDLYVREPGSGRRIGTLRVRYLELPQPGRDTLCFFTNLDARRLPAPAAARLYFERWGIETDFRLYKGSDHLPVVVSRRPDTVQQEVLLRLLAHNAVRYVQALACLRQHQQAAPTPPPPPVPTAWRPRHQQQGRPLLPIDLQPGLTAALLLGHMDQLAAAGPRGLPDHLDALLAAVTKHVIYAKPHRHYPRRGRKYQKGRRQKGDRRAQRRRWRQRQARLQGHATEET